MFDRLGKKVHPGTFGKTKVGEWVYPTSPSVKKHEICSDPISADPICPFPNPARNAARCMASATIGTVITKHGNAGQL